MRKFWILVLIGCALLVAGSLYAFSMTPVQTQDATAWTAIEGLPTPVLQDTASISCPFENIYCLDVWDPVTCSNGVTYSNECYARRACATGCTEGGPLS